MASSDAYLRRVVDRQMAAKLRSIPVVLVEGARGCGKTTTSRRFAASEALFDVDEAARAHAAHGTLPLLEGPHPMLLDEWPIVPGLWDRVRRASDRLGQPGRFILSASAQPTDYIIAHSGAGRMGRIRMRPMSLSESGASTGTVSLARLFDHGVDAAACRVGPVHAPAAVDELRNVIEWLLRGGWPLTRAMTPPDAQEYARDYLEICRADVTKASGVRHEPRSVRRLLASLGRNSACEAAASTLASDMGEQQQGAVARQTVRAYLDALESVFVYEPQPAWSARLLSRTPLRCAPKHHLVDPSLAAAAVGASEASLFNDRTALGLLFESMVIRDVRVYAGACRASVFHYRDKTGLEVDVVVERDDGKWIALEVKLGTPDSVDAAARSLLALKDKVDTARAGAPASLSVVTSTGQPYLRDDGVGVVPITSLGP